MPARIRPRDEIRRMLEQTLIPSPSVRELDPDTLEETTSRLAAPAGNAGEVYHLASKLSATGMGRLVDLDSAAFIRGWYFQTATEGIEALAGQNSSRVLPATALGPAAAWCLCPFTQPAPTAATLYGADLVISHGHDLWKLAPGSGGLTFEGTFGPDDAQRVASACRMWPPDVAPEATTFVFVVGAFTRSAYLGGARGYRHVVLNAGRAVGHVVSQWEALEAPRPTLAVIEEFVDREVDAVLRNDGVERGVLAVLALAERVPEEEDYNDHRS